MQGVANVPKLYHDVMGIATVHLYLLIGQESLLVRGRSML